MLQKYWKTIEEEEKDFLISVQRRKKLRHKVESLFPEDVEGTVYYDDVGITVIRAFIYLKVDASKEDTEKSKHFLVTLFGKATRDFREKEGRFMWMGRKEFTDEHGTYEELVLVENANPNGCKIIPVQKTITVYETDCKPEG